MTEYWGKLLKTKSTAYPKSQHQTQDSLTNLWDPITPKEIMENSIMASSAPGPDNISPAAWRQVPIDHKQLFFNICLLQGRCPAELTRTRTIFIPKAKLPTDPSEYQPISVSSVLIRQLHKILAQRITSARLYRTEQRASIPSDGTGENIAILDTILSEAKSQLRELHVATLDMAKAFNTVSHKAIRECCHEKGLPRGLIEYISNLYSNASTVLEIKGEKSESIRVGRGVRQGDPLSPALFFEVN